jgi:3-deoxy-D-manno-octulosonate 8-phosphate phosphatase (KDO 8-P phosphatase)
MKVPPKLKNRLKKIKMLVLDVDGILTDGSIQWIKGQGWTRVYSVIDGYGIKLIQQCGIPVAIMSGGLSEELQERIKVLKIEHSYLGNEDKLQSLEKLTAVTGIAPEAMAYVADELFDIPVLERVGFAATVPHAQPPVKKICHYVTKNPGGKGAVREVIELIRHAQKLGPYLEGAKK